MHNLIISYSLLSGLILGAENHKGCSYSQNVFEHDYNDSIPSWVKQLYERNGNEFLNNAIPLVVFFKKLSDSTSYCLYQVDDGVCQQTFLATQKNRKKKKTLQIGNECDQDFSSPEYSISTYKHDVVHNTFVLTNEFHKAKQKYLTTDQNGATRFKDGYNMENVETSHEVIKKKLSVNSSGNIVTNGKNSR